MKLNIFSHEMSWKEDEISKKQRRKMKLQIKVKEVRFRSISCGFGMEMDGFAICPCVININDLLSMND